MNVTVITTGKKNSQTMRYGTQDGMDIMNASDILTEFPKRKVSKYRHSDTLVAP